MFNGEEGSIITLKTGISQGSSLALGPTLYITYVNDYHSPLFEDLLIIQFVDDLTHKTQSVPIQGKTNKTKQAIMKMQIK